MGLGQKIGNHKDYDALMAAINAERLRLKEIQSSRGLGTEYLRIATAGFAKRYNDEALQRAAEEWKHIESKDAINAARTFEAELQLRKGSSRALVNQLLLWMLVAALLAGAIWLLRIFVG